jgi:hypothetical protein
MIRTGQQYLDSIRDAREVYIDGERVNEVTRHLMIVGSRPQASRQGGRERFPMSARGAGCQRL